VSAVTDSSIGLPDTDGVAQSTLALLIWVSVVLLFAVAITAATESRERR
jgi:hypothetical protein